MIGRVRHITITLDQDYRDKDVDSIVNAVRLIKGVAHVEPRIVDSGEHSARMAVRAELESKLHEAVESVFRQLRVRNVVIDRGFGDNKEG